MKEKGSRGKKGDEGHKKRGGGGGDTHSLVEGACGASSETRLLETVRDWARHLIALKLWSHLANKPTITEPVNTTAPLQNL